MFTRPATENNIIWNRSLKESVRKVANWKEVKLMSVSGAKITRTHREK
eukprot:CAMPEP_0197559114 /NCGR_PEP_ID=MMETSP1320-20131121/20607_1 /TAXON_ID=91990 /ORGANISM="Bolidomonas sp., Strain RCC2347" /LENGTH=47 /DNA_ID= /DNA_START= /DNA_END= /DNA_ORIENTATION=